MSNDKENAVHQAQMWALEARTHRDTVLSILRYFGLPEHDWEALSLIKAKFESPSPVSGDEAEGGMASEPPNIHLLWREACKEWGEAVGGPAEYEIFAEKLLAATPSSADQTVSGDHMQGDGNA